MSSRLSRRGFTLIELLVVVAIIALLISILLPSLSRAREQARISKCLANLKSMGTAAQTYLNDHARRDFPWVLHTGYYPYAGSRPYSFQGWTEFIYGGGMPEKEWVDENWFYDENPPTNVRFDIYVLEPRYRPMNPYFSTSVTWDRSHVEARVDPTPFVENLPDTFKCPSDNTAYVPDVANKNNEVEPDVAVPTWRVWGTSYPINWYWPYYYSDPWGTQKSAEEGKRSEYRGSGKWLRILGGAWSIPGLGSRMLGRNTVGGWESKFILFYENRLNLALEGARPRKKDGTPLLPDKAKNVIGWHRQLDRHAALMLDGHANYATMDTRFVDGPGWTNWPNRPWKDDWAEFNDY
jgi:prepilin-type N-terminal cleavage/methylation domain-containing protein